MRGYTLDIDRKLYELGARFYQGQPKNGSIRSVEVPPFLADPLPNSANSASGHGSLVAKQAADLRFLGVSDGV
jgi:hypothetical protein